MLHYTYTATGQKISQQLEDDGRLGTRREYAGPFVYVNNTLGWINTIYGRIVAVPKGGLRKELHLRDHTSTSLSTGLGNTRMVLEERDRNYEVVQEAAYYPFGMAIPTQSFALPNENNTYQNRYLYNGKEYQDDFGLNWYDYGARFYDPQIGRWHNLDPLAELGRRWSPYTHAFNNPIRFVDPDGRWPFDPQQTFDPLPGKGGKNQDIMDFFPDKDENESLFPFSRENICGCEGEKSGKNLMDYEIYYIGFRGKGNTNDNDKDSPGDDNNKKINKNEFAIILTAAGVPADITYHLVNWGMKGVKWGSAGHNVRTYLKVRSQLIGYALALNYLDNAYDAYISGSDLLVFTESIGFVYSIVLIRGGAPGIIIASPYLIIDNTIGVDNTIGFNIDYIKERNEQIRSGNRALLFWSPGRSAR